LRLAEAQSEAVHIANAALLRARGQSLQVRSQYFPQLTASLSYTRTLASQFEALSAGGEPQLPPGTPPVPPSNGTRYFAPCTRYLAPPGAGEQERLAGLEQAARCAAATGGLGIDFSRVGFGARNQYQLNLQGSLLLYNGGRVQSQSRAAAAAVRAAEVELGSQRAKVLLDVAEAYFDAVLADRLLAIAESSLVQTESALGQTRLARQVGNQSEFELLRAQVTRDNQVPLVLQRRTSRDIAHLRLKQLLNIPLGDSLRLTTDLASEAELRASAAAAGFEMSAWDAPDTSVAARAAVREAEAALAAQRDQARAAKAERIPAISLSSQYGRVAFPRATLPDLSSFLTNWTVSIGASFPLFTGRRIRGSTMVAEAGLREAEARLQQTRELAALDARQALAQLEEAEAAFQASAGTTEQAARAYAIAEVRFKEGLATQLELNDARLLLQQATANRAQAIRNLQVARMRLALLHDLPLGASPTTGFPGSSGVQGTAPGAALPLPGSQPASPNVRTAGASTVIVP
jgi:outer membrane protein